MPPLPEAWLRSDPEQYRAVYGHYPTLPPPKRVFRRMPDFIRWCVLLTGIWIGVFILLLAAFTLRNCMAAGRPGLLLVGFGLLPVFLIPAVLFPYGAWRIFCEEAA